MVGKRDKVLDFTTGLWWDSRPLPHRVATAEVFSWDKENREGQQLKLQGRCREARDRVVRNWCVVVGFRVQIVSKKLTP